MIRTVAKPEWVKDAVKSAIEQLQLIQDGRLPSSLHAQFLKGNAMRLLRCVTGSDLDTAVKVREWVLEDEEINRQIEAMTAEGLTGRQIEARLMSEVKL